MMKNRKIKIDVRKMMRLKKKKKKKLMLILKRANDVD